MESYWDLYVAYVNHCVEWNKKHGIDPHHYEMEWNHFLPQCIFGNQPIGHYLLLKQHAIATSLQTLAFKRNCLCPWHVKLLPAGLWELCKPVFKQQKKQLGKKGGTKTFVERTGIFDANYLASETPGEVARRNAEYCKENGLGLFSPGFFESEVFRKGLEKSIITIKEKFSKPVQVKCPDGTIVEYPSAGEAGRDLGLKDPWKLARNKNIIKKGHRKGYQLQYV